MNRLPVLIGGGLAALLCCASVWLRAEPPDVAARAPAIMSASKQAELRRLLPPVDDRRLAELLADPRLLFYTDEEMPRCYQDWSGALQGVHLASYNISADKQEPFGNGNLEFPWSAPGGTHRSPGVSTFRFLWLPLDEHGQTRPVAWYRKTFQGDNARGYGWIFPAGAVLGEVLLLETPRGERLAFELRIRERLETEWVADAFRPFPTAASLTARIQALRPDWQADDALRALVTHLVDEPELEAGELASTHPGRRAFVQAMGVDRLPPVGDEILVSELLAGTPFVSALGESWRSDAAGRRTNAPTTDADYHIVPAQYDGGFIDVDRVSCMRCHDSVNTNVRDFEFSRDWYGRIRGSDGIFSFHPFALESLSPNGFSQPVQIRSELTDAGWLAPYDIEQHPRTHYRRVADLDE